jgi:hypothetical protein
MPKNYAGKKGRQIKPLTGLKKSKAKITGLARDRKYVRGLKV